MVRAVTADEYFCADYAAARAAFLEAAEAAGATVTGYAHPTATGPDGGALSTDTARLGPADARTLIVHISGTHGVEGFAGSGCQVGLLRSGRASALPADTALLMVHALNPYGFAWLRRVNEDNVDLNRNFRDHAAPTPPNDAYAEVHDVLVPRAWVGPEKADTDAAILRMLGEDPTRFQAAVTSGQYTFPTGLFYGGTRPSWSAETLRRILGTHLAGVTRLGWIDVHTGLGDRGACELISAQPPTSAEYRRASRWFDGQVKSTAAGESLSADLDGVNVQVLRAWPEVEATCVAAEYGVVSILETLEALRADNWLHARGDPTGPEAPAIKQQIRDAFYGDDPAWKAQVYETGAGLFDALCRGLAEAR